MDEMIATALRERAEGDVHVERLLGAVRAGVKRQRRRRFALGCGAAAAVVTLAGVAGVVALPGRQPGARTGAPVEAGLPRPPSAGAVPTAVESPEVLASDPGLFHLDLIDLSGWRWVAWSATRSFEELSAEASESGGSVHILAARDQVWLGEWDSAAAVKTTVGGLPAETAERFGGHVVRWQPRPGAWVQVQASGPPDIAVLVAEKVRLDRVYRCAVPFRLAGPAVPPTVKCGTDFVLEDDGVTATAAGTVWLRQSAGGTEYQVAVGRSNPATVVDDTIEGRAVQVVEPPADGSAPPEIRYPYDGRTAYFWQFGAGPPAVLRALVAAFVPVPGRDPNAWPGTPS
jgi:hypothetical protein